ncbi:MAG: hypothetical protein JSR61_22555 [Proteobacteria bacterium]|nr:hypothetical protein [Pseudomonadota bacterium]
MTEAKTYLMTVTGTDGPPSLTDAATQIGVDVSHLSASFGVVTIDAAQHLYAVEVDADSVPPSSNAKPYRGPFSNPRIAPLGPDNPDKKKMPSGD